VSLEVPQRSTMSRKYDDSRILPFFRFIGSFIVTARRSGLDVAPAQYLGDMYGNWPRSTHR
jgi:hypothetical protein